MNVGQPYRDVWERRVLLLVLAGLLGELVAFALLIQFGLLTAALGASIGGALCIALAGAWLVCQDTRGL
jgi:hypothetical protein